MRRLVAIFAAVVFCGCVESTLTVTTDPPGAVVYLNDQEIGRTPVTRHVTWSGNYDVVIRADGHDTLKTSRWLIEPLYLQPPFDLLAEIVPFSIRTHKDWHFALKPASTQPVDQPSLVARAEDFKGQLESSPRTRMPMPSTQPGVQPATQPAAKQ